MDKDLALGGTTLAIAAGYYAMAAVIPQSLLADAVGPRRLPQTYAVLLAGLSLVLIVRSLRGGPKGPPLQRAKTRTKGPALHVAARWQPAAMLMIGVIYLLAVPWLGYILSLACLIAATAYCQGGRVDRKMLVIAVCGALFFWLLFVGVLGVPQPPGLWPSLS